MLLQHFFLRFELSHFLNSHTVSKKLRGTIHLNFNMEKLYVKIIYRCAGRKRNHEIVVGSNRKIVFTSKQRDNNYSSRDSGGELNALRSSNYTIIIRLML